MFVGDRGVSYALGALLMCTNATDAVVEKGFLGIWGGSFLEKGFLGICGGSVFSLVLFVLSVASDLSASFLRDQGRQPEPLVPCSEVWKHIVSH